MFYCPTIYGCLVAVFVQLRSSSFTIAINVGLHSLPYLQSQESSTCCSSSVILNMQLNIVYLPSHSSAA